MWFTLVHSPYFSIIDDEAIRAGRSLGRLSFTVENKRQTVVFDNVPNRQNHCRRRVVGNDNVQ